jgi:hypothetical protein
VVVLHGATVLETTVFFGAAPRTPVGPLLVGTLLLAAGTAALASSLRDGGDARLAPVTAGVLAGVATGFVLGSALTGLGALAAIATTGCLGVAWVALGVAVARDPGTYPERPL